MACEDDVCCNEIFIGDTGTSFQFVVYTCDETDPDNHVENLVDVSLASTMVITFLKPIDSSTLVVTNPEVQFLTDGTDSIIHYVTVESDLDQEGYWIAQLKVTMPDGSWYTSKINFDVSTPL